MSVRLVMACWRVRLSAERTLSSDALIAEPRLMFTKAATATVISRPMIATTASSSSSVKPARRPGVPFPCMFSGSRCR
jgi:hypothetical protein